MLLFAAKAPEYYSNSAFRIKILLIFLALAYHSLAVPAIAKRYTLASATPLGGKLAGGFSLALWFGVIAASRWIAYVAY
jgi:hypothetical protein